ncbi:MAG: trbN, partial [Caulobacteraceae bacterium]
MRAPALAFLLVATTARAETLHREVTSHRRERVTCSIAAALKFGIPANIMLAVAEMEGGRPGQRVRNRNGSLDVGPMQFNTRYLEHLERRYGITAADVAAAGCYPYELAAWRLRKHIELDAGDVWARAANYHSRSPAHNSKYRRKLIAKAAAWARRLSARELTYEARIPSTGGSGSNKQSRRERKPKRPTDSAGDLVPEVEDNGADLVLLLKLLSDEEGMHPVMALDSGSVGSAHAGSLRAAVQLPGHGGYVLRDPSRAWGTADTITRLTSAFDEVVRADPFAPRVRVHDLSLQ